MTLEDGEILLRPFAEDHARGGRPGRRDEALRMISEWAFETLELARLQLITQPEDLASERVAEKAGYHRERLLRAFAGLKSRRPDFHMCSLLPGDLG